MFFDLRRDINNIFDFPLMGLGYVDPLEELMDMRRRMIDVFDTHLPRRQALGDGKGEGEGEKGEEKEKEKEKEKEGEIVKEKEGEGEGRKLAMSRRGFGGLRHWVPRCDVHEDEKEYVVRAEIPGMKKEDIKVEYNPERHVMVVCGERKDVQEEKKDSERGGYHCVECNYGSFTRSFRVPTECWTKMDEMNAKCADGVLEIRCPKDEAKAEEKKVRSIEINWN
jgi:HSP20 family protein